VKRYRKEDEEDTTRCQMITELILEEGLSRAGQTHGYFGLGTTQTQSGLGLGRISIPNGRVGISNTQSG